MLNLLFVYQWQLVTIINHIGLQLCSFTYQGVRVTLPYVRVVNVISKIQDSIIANTIGLERAYLDRTYNVMKL